ncbi:ABC transporter permease [Roseomonas elaeocarpi]|uniref:ABC transporter permease n=1 Tax=Roseomonas elaeocarpi TaxID=907779 RepID=A0ABV6JW42_9PROT
MTALPANLLDIDAANPRRLARALQDIAAGLRAWRLSWALARLDLRNRYRGSVIGPFWMTLSTAAMLVGLGLLYSRLLGISLTDYLPHLAVSLVTWNVINGIVTDACTALTSADGVIRQMRLPYTTHALRCVFRNTLTAAHNIPLLFLVLLIFNRWPGAEVLLLIPGLLVLLVNALAAALLLGMLCARFRDIAQIVANVMQLAFFLSPVIWKADQLTGYWASLLPLNPFYDLLEVVRGPLVDGGGGWDAWLGAALYTVAAVVISLAFFVRFRGRLAFWV